MAIVSSPPSKLQLCAMESFYQLDPDFIMNSLEAAGLAPTGEYTQLNSYENRVFDIRLEKGRSQITGDDRVIAKFYRPGRWSHSALLDEHAFLQDLRAEGILAICPLTQQNGTTLSEHSGIYLTVFPKVLGRNPEEFLGDELKQVGRTLARIHNVGARRHAQHRLSMTAEDMGWPALELLEESLAPEIRSRYLRAAEDILYVLEDRLDPSRFIRIHGDCHKGNLLHRNGEFYFLDFDDFVNGPVAQDFWMLLGGNSEETQIDRNKLLEGYEELREIPDEELELFEPLRGLRIIHYAAWITRRWEDPSFPRLFPDFGSYRYWAEETEALEKIAWSLED